MDVKEAIEQRRAFRSLAPVEITKELINDLAHYAQLAPSCFNKQPWQYVFVYEPEMLEKMHKVLPSGNAWIKAASLIIAVLGKKENDCVMKDGRVYYHFDIGMATAFMILRATELGLVAHPVAGYNAQKTREILGIPQELEVVTLVNVGKHAAQPNSLMSKDQVKTEQARPVRQPLQEFVHLNHY